MEAVFESTVETNYDKVCDPSSRILETPPRPKKKKPNPSFTE
ncbi:hypothetical protein [Leptospira yasudae]|nr:hypothetical protein [Leptospira yasudae]